MTKTTPSRSEGQGWIESSVKNFRHLFTKLLVSAPPSARTSWHTLAKFTQLMWNNSIPYSKAGIKLSRFQLALTPFRKFNGVLSHSTEDDSSNLECQKYNLDKLRGHRALIQSKYPTKANPFSPNQLCRLVKSKAALDSIKGGTGLQNSSQSLLRVDEAAPSNCRLTDLEIGSKRTLDWGRLQPVPFEQLQGNIGLDVAKHPNKFAKNIYVRGINKPLLQTLDLDRDRTNITSIILNAGNKRLLFTSEQTKPSESADEIRIPVLPEDDIHTPQIPPLPETTQNAQPPEIRNSMHPNGNIRPSHRYNTRNRDKNKSWNIHFSELKSVSFNSEVFCVKYKVGTPSKSSLHSPSVQELNSDTKYCFLTYIFSNPVLTGHHPPCDARQLLRRYVLRETQEKENKSN